MGGTAGAPSALALEQPDSASPNTIETDINAANPAHFMGVSYHRASSFSIFDLRFAICDLDTTTGKVGAQMCNLACRRFVIRDTPTISGDLPMANLRHGTADFQRFTMTLSLAVDFARPDAWQGQSQTGSRNTTCGTCGSGLPRAGQ